jgi:hypothetical protein
MMFDRIMNFLKLDVLRQEQQQTQCDIRSISSPPICHS